MRLACLLALLATPLAAHEFWIDPVNSQVAQSDTVQAEIRVGQDFLGNPQVYLPRDIKRSDFALAGRLTAIEGRAGDRPALTFPLAGQESGLATLVHVTRDYRLTYRDFAKFEAFLDHKDALWVLEAHAARGLPSDVVVEQYSRHAKSLISVGPVQEQAQGSVFGLEVELIAHANPYTPGLAKLPIELRYQGAPLANAQIEVFERPLTALASDAAPEELVKKLYRTDANAMVSLPIRPGRRYLVDHVVLRPLDPAQPGDPVWESLWASLTFEVPE